MTALPVLATVSQAYGALSSNSAALGHIVQRTAIVAAGAFAASYLLVSLAQGDPNYAEQFNNLPAGKRVASVASLAVLVVSIATFAILVRWHRLIIRQLPPEATRKGAAHAGFLYFARSMLLGAIGPAVAIVFGVLPAVLLHRWTADPSAKQLFAGALVAMAAACALLLASRLSLVLPAAAVGDHQVTLRRSWGLTRGNSWRMLLGSALASGPAIAVTVAVNAFVEAMPTLAGNTTSLTIALLLSLALVVVTAVIQASFLSYAYLFFTKDSRV